MKKKELEAKLALAEHTIHMQEQKIDMLRRRRDSLIAANQLKDCTIGILKLQLELRKPTPTLDLMAAARQNELADFDCGL